MKLLFQLLVFLFVAEAVRSRLQLSKLPGALSKIGKKFGSAANYLDDIQHVGDLAGYNFAVLGTYWRSNALAAFSQMKNEEKKQATETLHLAISTLVVWDVGQGILQPIADTLINKVIRRHQKDFYNTVIKLREYRLIFNSDLIDRAPTVGQAEALKARLLEAKTDVVVAFQTDVEKGWSKFVKNTAIYDDMVKNLKGVRKWAKAAKWADVLAGPLFDAATIAFGAWQLSEAIKNDDPYAIASSSLSIASGVAGITGFVVGALATVGSTLAAVAGPVGAIIGALLGIASIIVEIVAAFNPYTRINKEIKFIKTLRDNSKKLLDADMKNLASLVSSRNNFTFSWVFEANQGLMVEYIHGRIKDWDDPLKFRLETPAREESGYIVVGKNRKFDKGRYGGNVFFKPGGLTNLGYDYYGKKAMQKFKGATVLVSTAFVDEKPDVDLKGVDIKTYNDKYPNEQDNVVIDNMISIAPKHTVQVKTGGGDDVIQINGVIGKPGDKKYFSDLRYGYYLDVEAGAANTEANTEAENNVLSFEGMPSKKSNIVGVNFNFKNESLLYRIGNKASPNNILWGRVKGIKMFVGSPFDDIVYLTNEQKYVVRQSRGKNQYFLELNSWKPFHITIDDQCEEPGKLTIYTKVLFYGDVRSSHLITSQDRRTLYLYGRQRNQAWQLRGQIYFNRRRGGYHVIRTEKDRVEKRLDEFGTSFSPPGERNLDFFDSDKDYHYYSDRNLQSGDCGVFKVFLHTPRFQRGRYRLYMFMRKNSNDFLVMTTDFVQKCIKKTRRAIALVRSGFHSTWKFKLMAAGDVRNLLDCPGTDLELDIEYFEKLMEQRTDGSLRLVVDLWRDKRSYIDIATEIRKLENRQKYRFDRNLEGNFGIPQVVTLEPPQDKDPSTISKFTLDMKGGQKVDEDSVIFTKSLLDWLKANERKMMLKKAGGGTWKLEITKQDGTPSHEVTLKNIERIDFEAKDSSFRQPVIPDLAAETKTSIDLASLTAYKNRRGKMYYDHRFNDCYRVGKEKL